MEIRKYRKKPVVVEAYQTMAPMVIETLEGVMHANQGDYIITGVRGEKYPCKPDIFAATYDAVQNECARPMSNANMQDATAHTSDIKVHGDPGAWECVCKASSENQGWMRSTKRMRVDGGWLYNVSHVQRNPDGSYALSEAVTFVPALD